MNKKLKQKGLNEYKIIIPMSDETVKSIKANAAKTILSASIAGFMMFGGQSAKAESVSEPQAIIQTAETQNEAEKKELYLEIDKLMSFNKAARVENDEQKFAKRKIQNANTASVDLEENLHQSSVRDEASADAVIETTSIAEKGAEKGQSESNDEILSAISKKETDEESVLNNAENKKDFEAEIASVASIDGKEDETKTEISKASEESDIKKAASLEDDKNLETVSGAEAEKNIEEKVQTDEAKETITEDKTVETSEVQSEEEKTHPEEAGQTEKSELSLDDFINNKGIEDLFDVDKISEVEEKPEVTEEKTPEAQGASETAPVESKELNYAEDEKKIRDYSEEERYRSTEMEQGNGTSFSTVDTPSMDSKDGFSYETLEPSATSDDKTQWGLEMEFDKEKGQRTYTDFGFTNSGNQAGVLDPGSISANEVGDKLSEKGNFNDPTYKAKAEVEITGSRVQRNENLYSTKEDLEHINNVNTKDPTIIAWEGKYKKDNANGLKATQGPNSSFTFSVNPWPNENDKLDLIKLNGSHNQKEFVQGQTITTNVQVENLDDNARERLVGQVYHPITGEVVEGAKAYINDEGKVVVEMPKGTINADGTLNKDSIFYKDAKYKGIQNLEVKFFARPRTADEFRGIVEANGQGFYTSTGAGTRKINHDGKEVEVDLQGIDRYDHYNLIGGFKLNLDDTRYYDQDFKDKNQDDTSKHTHSKVKP
ncbi:MAG: hypothetical protein PT942_00550, partial [Eubacteriales bacterium]|nr:hypothetical protein [Eubacteriales bacterium]